MPFLSPKRKRDFFKILPFGIIWLVLGWIFLWIEYASLVEFEFQNIPTTGFFLTPKIFLFASVSVFFIGCLVGFLEVRYLNKYFTSRSFPAKLVGKFVMYTLFLLIVMFIFYQLAASIEMQKPLFSKEVFERYKLFFFSITNISASIQLGFSLLLSLLYAEVRDNLGQNVLLNFFTGKYHKPIVENRIFMFTDMKDSTAIAEKLGNIAYFKFLRSYYNDLSSAILNHNGEVYQYIGDEIVISWQSNRYKSVQDSINCFFSMQKGLLEKKPKYIKEYGLFPKFKGAIHKGEVTVGEIGALKKEIFFTGDVLNTTARIQNLCSKFNVDLLVSEIVITTLSNKDDFILKHIDAVNLKGKTSSVNIIGVTKKVIN
ncbi:adenylate/guanylate cyclase domain-containing protein [Polaribacter sp. R77954]|uniref:adenylate/guanylate cyclase domain-containing protein n=1 Tax=Polaribacter sp. R77954 TaxID=3093870 RepID=UPI0037C8683B